jgi:hypothetical protein
MWAISSCLETKKKIEVFSHVPKGGLFGISFGKFSIPTSWLGEMSHHQQTWKIFELLS